jgi:hypothetical protein
MRDYHDTPPWRAVRFAAGRLDRRVGWDRLWRPVGLGVLIGLRDTLRRDNLFDPSTEVALNPQPLPPEPPGARTARTADGSYNDLDRPATGMAGTRFGRNVPLAAARRPTDRDVLEPSPREISRALMTRRGGRMIEAEGVNALVSAWLQFMIRDWFSHGPGSPGDAWQIELAPGDPWPRPAVTVLRTLPDPSRPAGAPDSPPTSINSLTHWWDASQLYGTGPEQQRALRTGTGGRLRLDAAGLPAGAVEAATEPGFWAGLALLQTLFVLEHNAVCDRLQAAYPGWGDEEVFQRARLVVAALIAKIHTVEWTPSVIGHPTTRTAMRANWFGLQGEHLTRAFGRVSGSEVLSGIPGSPVSDYGVPYALTEEFAAVYRMHPLLRDYYDLRSVADDSSYGTWTLRDLSGPGGIDVLGKVTAADLLYSFGTEQPGVVTLHNFPKFLQEFVRPDNGEPMDLAATDILRHRELGVPRYCEFRRLLHRTVPRSYEEISSDPDTVRELRRIYGPAGVEDVDLMVGLFAERLPTGFAFSDTAFRIFILMASRRLNSDRFFTTDFTPAVYTPEGLEWIAANSMRSVLLRHFPELRPALRATPNAFSRWQRSG